MLDSNVDTDDREALCLLFDILVDLKDVVAAEKWLQARGIILDNPNKNMTVTRGS